MPLSKFRPGTGDGASAGERGVVADVARAARGRADHTEAGRPPGEAVNSNRASIKTVEMREDSRSKDPKTHAAIVAWSLGNGSSP